MDLFLNAFVQIQKHPLRYGYYFADGKFDEKGGFVSSIRIDRLITTCVGFSLLVITQMMEFVNFNPTSLLEVKTWDMGDLTETNIAATISKL